MVCAKKASKCAWPYPPLCCSTRSRALSKPVEGRRSDFSPCQSLFICCPIELMRSLASSKSGSSRTAYLSTTVQKREGWAGWDSWRSCTLKLRPCSSLSCTRASWSHAWILFRFACKSTGVPWGAATSLSCTLIIRSLHWIFVLAFQSMETSCKVVDFWIPYRIGFELLVRCLLCYHRLGYLCIQWVLPFCCVLLCLNKII